MGSQAPLTRWLFFLFFFLSLSLTLVPTICPLSLALQKGPHYVAQTSLQLRSFCLSFSSAPRLPDTLFCTSRRGSLTMHGLHSQAAARDLLTTRRPSESPASSSPRLRGTPEPDSASQGPAPPPAVFLAGWSGRGRALRDPEAYPRRQACSPLSIPAAPSGTPERLPPTPRTHLAAANPNPLVARKRRCSRSAAAACPGDSSGGRVMKRPRPHRCAGHARRRGTRETALFKTLFGD